MSKAKKDVRINKTKERRYEDFYDYFSILGEAIHAYESQEVVRLQDRHIKVMLFALRSLLGRECGLIEEICLTHQINPSVTFKGYEGIPDTHPSSKDRTMTLAEYLSSADSMYRGEHYSIRKFVYNYASQDASHSDPSQSEMFAFCEQFYFFGQQPHKQQVLAIARTVHSVCNSIIDALVAKYPQPQKT